MRCATHERHVCCLLFTFSLLLLNNCKLDMLGQIQLRVLPAHHGQRENKKFVMFLIPESSNEKNVFQPAQFSHIK